MKKINEDETENKNEPLKDCNCLNCRLGRIEDQLDHVQHVLDSLALPANPSKSSNKIKRKK